MNIPGLLFKYILYQFSPWNPFTININLSLVLGIAFSFVKSQALRELVTNRCSPYQILSIGACESAKGSFSHSLGQ